jgi:hypothetical protein
MVVDGTDDQACGNVFGSFSNGCLSGCDALNETMFCGTSRSRHALFLLLYDCIADFWLWWVGHSLHWLESSGTGKAKHVEHFRIVGKNIWSR